MFCLPEAPVEGYGTERIERDEKPIRQLKFEPKLFGYDVSVLLLFHSHCLCLYDNSNSTQSTWCMICY